METTTARMTESGTAAGSTTTLARARDVVTNSLRYWEPRRIVYNMVLAAVVLAHFAAAWPADRAALSLNGLLFLFILAVLANVAYCAAYVGDVFVQLSGFDQAWYRWRWLLFVLGTLFAAVITRFFSLGFFSR